LIKITKLPVERWADYRDLRLEALKSDPSAFGSAFEEEVARAFHTNLELSMTP
jgi:hypothetical protein